jgi:hypothetical protein
VWRGLQPAGFGPGLYEHPQAEARATGASLSLSKIHVILSCANPTAER